MSFTVRLIVALALCSTGFTAPARAQTNASNGGYLFPTDASRRVNSGFADFRDTHFHGGIDISTNGKIGYPVYAAKSGYVYRVTVSPYGYGRRIVLRHDDSTYTLYAHLSAFSKEIEERVKAAQASTGRYNVDLRFRPGEIRVERGAVIGRTGATGAGGPHLHFEIHDRNYGFVDPLIYKSLDITDRMTPKVFGVGVRGFYSGNARLSGVVRLRRGYRAEKTFDIHEPFFFVIHAADSYRRGRYKRPPKHIELRIDGKKYLSVDLTHIDAADYLDVSSLVDSKLSRGHSYKTYYKLCVDRAAPFTVVTPSAPLSANSPNS
ncbi:MAG: M23 family metallopeptidase [Chloroflexi bacterium]|nr:M23 family metallopeptidase [Chloroflexota bacterium]